MTICLRCARGWLSEHLPHESLPGGFGYQRIADHVRIGRTSITCLLMKFTKRMKFLGFPRDSAFEQI